MLEALEISARIAPALQLRRLRAEKQALKRKRAVSTKVFEQVVREEP
jgi:hypothetical protein